ncbi:MAG: bifunctional tetrahydrofolate synthase/dihydrofolate synthase [Gammaproteobacteria bacterium]|nr:bifunctional tetrahydrofolate synthase/dihydrofolate synthase [Gammaproteobacteria bacterium]
MPGGRTLAEWLAYQETLHPQAIDLGLERVRAVADRLGLLPLAGRSAIVGGTNGKGSTATLLAAMGRAHGARVGLFTSPHLLRYQERIRIDGAEVGDAALCAAFEQVEAVRPPQSLTYFEFNTLAALLVFRAAAVELTVLEVGLGGRLDATNLVDADVAVLCSVAMDHREWLGDTLEAIGAEKAGIFRAGKPVVLGSAQMPATVRAALAALDNRPVVVGEDIRWRVHADGRWDVHGAGIGFQALAPPALAGEIQYRNAATALAALRALLAPRAPEPAAVSAALQAVRLAGRLQIVNGPVEWVFDVAHNEAAAALLATQLRARPATGRTLAVFAALGDKDIGAIAAQLDPLVDHWLLCQLPGARALEPTQLQRRMGRLRGTSELAGEVAAAAALAAARAQPGDRVLVCGSFHTVGPALAARRLY